MGRRRRQEPEHPCSLGKKDGCCRLLPKASPRSAPTSRKGGKQQQHSAEPQSNDTVYLKPYYYACRCVLAEVPQYLPCVCQSRLTISSKPGSSTCRYGGLIWMQKICFFRIVHPLDYLCYSRCIKQTCLSSKWTVSEL